MVCYFRTIDLIRWAANFCGMYIILGADGKEYGPVTASHVIDWLHDGRVNLETKAKHQKENVWKTVGSFAEFNRQPTPVLPSAPPLSAGPLPVAEPVAIEASRWLRLPAALIDGFLKTLCYLPITIPVLRVAAADALRGEERSFAEMSERVAQIVEENAPHALPWFAALVLLQAVLLAWRGQSIGKLLLGLRIVRLPEQTPAGFTHAFMLRGALPFLIEQVLFVVGQNPLLGLMFWAVDAGMIFRSDRRCLHDLIAGTKVIKA